MTPTMTITECRYRDVICRYLVAADNTHSSRASGGLSWAVAGSGTPAGGGDKCVRNPTMPARAITSVAQAAPPIGGVQELIVLMVSVLLLVILAYLCKGRRRTNGIAVLGVLTGALLGTTSIGAALTAMVTGTIQAIIDLFIPQEARRGTLTPREKGVDHVS